MADDRPKEDQTDLLRKEVAEQRQRSEKREEREKIAETLKNRVSVAAIILTTALSFIGNVKSNREGAIASNKEAAEAARVQAAELWAYYQTGLAERTSLELAHDQIRFDLKKRGVSENDPSVKLESLKLADYQARIRDFDIEARRVFYRVQDLEEEQDRSQRRMREPGKAATRYDLGTKLITLALILLSVTILSNRRWLFWGGISLGTVGLLIALNGYFLFF